VSWVPPRLSFKISKALSTFLQQVQPDIVVERNEGFTPKSNYTIVVILKNPDKSKDLKFDLYLADQKLGNSTNPGVFQITGAQAKYLNDAQERIPEKLPLRLVFK